MRSFIFVSNASPIVPRLPGGVHGYGIFAGAFSGAIALLGIVVIAGIMFQALVDSPPGSFLLKLTKAAKARSSGDGGLRYF
jgi:hypothetical protein